MSVLIRRVNDGGGFAAVVRRGATEAGAVFIVERDRFGGVVLYGPAAQTSYGDEPVSERLFAAVPVEGEEAVDARLERERKFDPDIWVVEIEPGRDPIGELVSLAKP